MPLRKDYAAFSGCQVDYHGWSTLQFEQTNEEALDDIMNGEVTAPEAADADATAAQKRTYAVKKK